MKILLITDLYPIKRGDSNSPITLHNFAFEWIRQGHEVDVIKPNFLLNSLLRKKPFYKTGFYDYEGVKIFNVNYFTPFLFDVTKKLPATIKISDYNLIVAHMPSGIMLADVLARKFNKPLITGVHCSDIEVLKNPIYRHYFKPALENAYRDSNKIACRSLVLQKKFIELMPELAERTFVAASGIPKENIVGKELSFSSPLTSHPSPFKVLTCANLIKRKNIDKLIMAINNSTDFELTVIGDGAEFKNLNKIATKNIKFLGKLPHEKVLEEMRNSDIFILPSVNETFGMVYLEAMASGCVTVCSKDDGIDGIIKDSESGFLTEPTVEGIKKTLRRIKDFNNIEKILENSLATAKNYTQENCAKNYLKNCKP